MTPFDGGWEKFESSLPLREGEELLTKADFAICRGWHPRGTLFLTTEKLVWMRWPWLNPGLRSWSSLLTDVVDARQRRKPLHFFRRILLINTRDHGSIGFVPVHWHFPLEEWATAIHDVAEVSRQ